MAVVIIFTKFESLYGFEPIRSSFSKNIDFVFSESLLHKINKHLISISDCWLTNILFVKCLARFVQLLLWGKHLKHAEYELLSNLEAF